MTDSDSERPTDPSALSDFILPDGLYIIPAEVITHIIDSQMAIHEELRQLKMASKIPPEWAEKLIAEYKEIKINCKKRHENGTSIRGF